MTEAGYKRVSRRAFVRLVTAFTGALVGTVLGLPVIGYLISPALRKEAGDNDPILVGPVENYPAGIPTYFSITHTKVNGWERTANVIGMYILRKDDGSVRVFSGICTHLGCLVTWHPDIQEYVSPCHDGRFDVDGFVTKGPPPRPMDEFETKIEDGILYVMNPPFRRFA